MESSLARTDVLTTMLRHQHECSAQQSTGKIILSSAEVCILKYTTKDMKIHKKSFKQHSKVFFSFFNWAPISKAAADATANYCSRSA